MAHHDSFCPYNLYHECQHSLCCTRFVRELIFAIDRSLQRK